MRTPDTSEAFRKSGRKLVTDRAPTYNDVRAFAEFNWDADEIEYMTPTYCIVRFRASGMRGRLLAVTYPAELRNLTLAEAQEHCQREDTHGDGWFDGYERE